MTWCRLALGGPIAGLLVLGALAACGAKVEKAAEVDMAEAGRDRSAMEGADRVSVPSESRATFGGGCFWCTEAVFDAIEGVADVRPGYAGGRTENPTYQEVSAGATGHAEVIQVRFDPQVVDYATLLEVFFRTHDPTTKDRQGGDVGSQYRSVVFAHDESQRRQAEEAIRRLEEEKVYAGKIVTEVVPYRAFYPAEDYHHDYFARNASQGYCRAVIVPKLEKFKKAFAHLLAR